MPGFPNRTEIQSVLKAHKSCQDQVNSRSLITQQNLFLVRLKIMIFCLIIILLNYLIIPCLIFLMGVWCLGVSFHLCDLHYNNEQQSQALRKEHNFHEKTRIAASSQLPRLRTINHPFLCGRAAQTWPLPSNRIRSTVHHHLAGIGHFDDSRQLLRSFRQSNGAIPQRFALRVAIPSYRF